MPFGTIFGARLEAAPNLLVLEGSRAGSARRLLDLLGSGARVGIEVMPPGVAVAFAAFLGLALARAVDSNLVAMQHGAGPMHRHWPVPVTSWPLVVVGAVVYGFDFAILGALPASRLIARPKIDAEADRRFWTFVREHTQPDERSQ